MRLLQLRKHGEVSLTKDLTGNIPPYAILSHTWGADDEEVTFEDLKQGVGKNKAGYKKISFCGKQAAEHDLGYVWIDTCCIDKSSSAELSEALISMFRWYSQARRCYVYLADVSKHDGWQVDFYNSKWFTRGWTLQELLAPSSVEFFSREGKRLGDKDSLYQHINNITGIPTNAIQGKSLSSFSVEVRMSWADKRQTKREEDKAYSLMGMVSICMPPLYGEGRESAMERLHKEIDEKRKLLHAKNWFDANTSISQDESGTVFTLHPRGGQSVIEIVEYDLNKERIMQDPDDPLKQALKASYDLPSRKRKKCVLLSIGGRSDNDIILPEWWKKRDRCYFYQNPRTGEVLLHDKSKRRNTSLRYNDAIEQLPNKEPRQCVVLQGREAIFRIGGKDGAEFLLKWWKVQNPELHAKKRQSFLSKEEFGQYEETLDQFHNFDVQSVVSSVCNTRMNTPSQPEPGNDIKYSKLEKLGDGSQCTIYEVVDMYTGDHYAARAFHKPEKQFKQKVRDHLSLEMKTVHKNLLVPLFLQESPHGRTLTAFYDVCHPSLEWMIENFGSLEERRRTTSKMFLDVTSALGFLHNQKITHENVKPSKILWRNDGFVLSGFGIAMTSSYSVGGTDSYTQPEHWSSPEGDIYRLGAITIECLERFPKEEDRLIGQGWHEYLQTRAAGRLIASMLASDPKQRPTARELLDTYFPYSLPSREWSTTLSQDTPTLLDGVLTRLRDIDSTRHNKLGIARTKPANSTHQERGESQKSNKPSRRQQKRLMRKQEMKGAGKDPRPRS